MRAGGDIAAKLGLINEKCSAAKGVLEQILDLVASIAKIPGPDRYREPILKAAIDALRSVKERG